MYYIKQMELAVACAGLFFSHLVMKHQTIIKNEGEVDARGGGPAGRQAPTQTIETLKKEQLAASTLDTEASEMPKLNTQRPFFGSSVTQNVDPMRGTETLELFTGVRPTFKHKTEVENMFTPQRNLTNIHGAPGVSGQTQDRYKPATEKRFVKPTEQIRVGPGINVGTDVISTGGFHDQTRFMPQIVDEHRINQLPGNIIVGSALNTKRDHTPAEFTIQNEYSETRPRQLVPIKASVDANTKRSSFPRMENKEIYTANVPVGIAAPIGSHVPTSALGHTVNNTDREWCNQYTGIAAGPDAGAPPSSMGEETLHTTDRELASMDFNAGFHSERNMAGGKSGFAPPSGQTKTGRETLGISEPTNAFSTAAKAVKGIIPTMNTNDTTMREMISGSDHVGGAHVSSGIGRQPLHKGLVGDTERGEETHRSTYNTNIMGPASSVIGASGAPVTYDQLLKQQGLSLRSVTDESRAPSTLRLNENLTGSVPDTLRSSRVKAPTNLRGDHYGRNPQSQRQNEFVHTESIPMIESHPNRVEVLNNRVTSIANDIPNQLRDNPFVPSS